MPASFESFRIRPSCETGSHEQERPALTRREDQKVSKTRRSSRSSACHLRKQEIRLLLSSARSVARSRLRRADSSITLLSKVICGAFESVFDHVSVMKGRSGLSTTADSGVALVCCSKQRTRSFESISEKLQETVPFVTAL
ncbi:hypothetical protein TGMAS_231865 [Toxoplasma gondii MAS]|uniref:Uncharacterized protein n=1 Tax=Toxoplasma gondii MAS TaxID=943118 RepID=A0A086QXS1_TOXGO|nr:hypothetical protein TGMAS_231865 [Toxoplasma gondii MAS]